MEHNIDVDEFGVPVDAFGGTVPPEFFGLLGRLLAVNGKIEYLYDRLKHLPVSETASVKKVDQFEKRVEAGRAERNAVVHSWWTTGAHDDPETIVGVRYKTRKLTSGLVAEITLSDAPEAEPDPQDVVLYSVESLKRLLRRDVTTMLIGQLAYTEVMSIWAVDQVLKNADL